MTKLRIKNKNGEFDFSCQLCGNSDFKVTLYQGKDMYICSECREWYIPNPDEVVTQGEKCPDCGAIIPDGGSCFYCETDPRKQAEQQ